MSEIFKYYQSLIGSALRKLYADWGFIGAAVFAFVWLMAHLFIISVFWAFFSIMIDDDSIPLIGALVIITPHILLTVAFFFKSVFLAAEYMWKFFGIYRLFGVSGMPIRDSIFGLGELE